MKIEVITGEYIPIYGRLEFWKWWFPIPPQGRKKLFWKFFLKEK